MTKQETNDRAPVQETLSNEERDILRQFREDREELARRLLYRTHYGAVGAIAEDVLGAVLRREIDGPEALDERLHEEADSACTYTSTNLRTVHASENWDAGLDEMGSDLFADVEDSGTLFGRLAYFAMRADIRERLGLMVGDESGAASSVDLDDEDTYPANAPDLDQEAVEDGAARTAFVLAWVDAEEREGRTYPGEDLDDVAPAHVPGRLRAWARDVVAEAFGATTLGDGIAEAWARADAEDLGRALALSCGGWTDGLGEQDLPEPIRLPSMGEDARLWVEPADFRADAPTIADLRRIEGSAEDPEAAAELILAAIESDSPEDALGVADRWLQGFGVESLDLPSPDHETDRGAVRYVNLGDTYAATLCYVEDAYTPVGRFVVADWGSLLEQAEEERTYATGEVRCGYCGEWTEPGECHESE